ncbi:MAG: lactate racemase domain-containing protein [bacterium]
MISKTRLRAGAWYGDEWIELQMPSSWDVTVLWPQAPPPLTDEQIISILERPVGQAPFKEICKGRSRPLIIVDDLNRPTPVARVMPFLLKYFCDAGIQIKNITILMATGTHGEPLPDAMNKKIGAEAASFCRLLIHNCFRNVKKNWHNIFWNTSFRQ